MGDLRLVCGLIVGSFQRGKKNVLGPVVREIET